MTGSIGESAEALAVVVCALVLLTALLAWRSGPIAGRRAVPDVAIDGDRSTRLPELREHLDREFVTAARALATISPASHAALQAPQSAERLTAAVNRTTRYLDTLRDSPPDPSQASACYGQARAIGLSLVKIHDLALSAARYPHDDVPAADLASALAGLDQAVANLRLLTVMPSEKRMR